MPASSPHGFLAARAAIASTSSTAVVAKRHDRHQFRLRRPRKTPARSISYAAVTQHSSAKEELVRKTILSLFREELVRPAALEYVRQRVAERLGELGRHGHREILQRRKELDAIETKLGNVLEAIADGYKSDYTRAQHDQLVAQAKAKQALIETLERHAASPVKLPSPDEMVQRVYDLEAMVAVNPKAAQQALRRLFKDGRVILDPLPDKGYLVRTEILPLVLLGGPSPQDLPGEMVPYAGSGGGI